MWGRGRTMASFSDPEYECARTSSFRKELVGRACLLVVAVAVGLCSVAWIILTVTCVTLRVGSRILSRVYCISSSVISRRDSSSRIRPASCGRVCWLDSSRRRGLCAWG